MTEAVATSNDADSAAQRAAEQARLRKERREAKIKAGGSARLNKIAGADGRVMGDNTFLPPSSTEASQAAPTSLASQKPSAIEAADEEHDDPDEVDISDHHYLPSKNPNSVNRAGPQLPPDLSEDQLRQMMLGMDRPVAGSQTNMPAGMEEDPLTKMMSQMMGGMGGFPGMPGQQGNGTSNSPFPGMPNLFPQQPQQPVSPDPYTSLWRLLHALVALGLGVYVAFLTAFTGTKHEREREAVSSDPLADANKRHKNTFFWVFATAETLLLTTRFFLDKRRAHPPGFLYTVIGYLPEPYKGYVEVALRYVQMVTTVRADILASMFVLGVCAWWNS